MNKNLLITLAVVGALAFFGFYFFNNKSESTKVDVMVEDTMTDTQTEVVSTTESATMTTGSLSSLMTSGQNTVCTFSSDQNGMNVDGLVHVSGTNMNGTFSVQSGEESMSSHMISDGTWVYLWTDGSPQGIKMNVSEMEGATTTQPSGFENLNQEYDFSCSPWVVDSMAFQLPEGVSFMEL